jgi:hypothetical protein
MTRDRLLKAIPVALVAAAFAAAPGFAQQQQRPSQSQPSRPAAPPAPAPAAAPKGAAVGAPGGPQLLGQFGDWGAYTASAGGKKVCFALAKPARAQTNPPNRPRDPAYMFVSSRPSERVKDEVSIVVGYGLKPNSEASIEVAGGQFAMYTQNDGAWIKNAAEESRLVDALRRGTDAVVKGTSARGTQSTDTYALRGLSQALDRVGQECR